MVKNNVTTFFENAIYDGCPSTLEVRPTTTMPTGVISDSFVTQQVKPVELPQNQLFIGGTKGK